MENQDNTSQVSGENTSFGSENPSSGVSFPTVGAPKKSGGAKTLLIVGILVLAGVLGFVIYKNASNGDEGALAQPTPFENLSNPQEVLGESTPAATATPKPADKSKVKIEIQNGTGITGEAAYLQTQLEGLGFTGITVGNASQQNATSTTVTFAKSLDASIVDEITKKLNSLYTKVEVKTATTATLDVVIVTGLRKGATPKASATPAASPSATASPSASPIPTGTQ